MQLNVLDDLAEAMKALDGKKLISGAKNEPSGHGEVLLLKWQKDQQMWKHFPCTLPNFEGCKGATFRRSAVIPSKVVRLEPSGRIRRLKRTVPFTFRRLEGGLQGGASRGASSPSQGGLKGAWRGLHLCEAFKGLKGALRGLEKGFKGASRGLQGGFKGAWRGLEKGFKGASRALEKGLKGAWRWRLRRGLEGGLRRASRGLQKGFKGAWEGLQWGFEVKGASRGLQKGFRGLRRAWRGFKVKRASRRLGGGFRRASEGFKGASERFEGGLSKVRKVFEKDFWEGCAAWSLAPQTDHLRLQ